MTETISSKPASTPQRFRQKESTRWNSYDEARAWFSQLPKKTRKRIRRRADGHFDVVIYEATPPPKAKEAVPEAADEAVAEPVSN
jgi:hypothetical protein